MSSLKRFVKYNAHHRLMQRQSIMLTTTLSVLIMFLVSFILTKPADSMTGQLICASEAHIHDESCYALECEYELQLQEETILSEEEVVAEGEEIQVSETEIISDEPIAAHEHTDECFRLICEKQEHEHSQDCYETIQEETTAEDSEDFLSVIYDSGIELAADEDISAQADVEYFESAVTEIPSTGTLINIRDFLINDATGATGIVGTASTPYDESTTDLYGLTFRVSASDFLKDKEMPIYFYYEMPEGLKFKEDTFGASAFSEEGLYTSTYYSLANREGKNSLVVFRMTEEYYDNKINISTATNFSCTLEFSGVVNRAPTDSGDVELVYNDNIKETIPFSDKTLTMNKASNGIKNNAEIEWVVSINDNTYSTDFKDALFEDSMISKVIPESVKLEPDDGFVDTSTWKFNRDIAQGETVKITYRTKIDPKDLYMQNGSRAYKNTALVNKNGTELVKSNEVTVYANPAGTINKNAVYDYEKGSGASINQKTEWSVNLGTNYGLPLGGYKLYDAAFSEASLTDLKIYDTSQSPQVELIKDTDYTLSDNEMKFNDSVSAKSIKVVYKTDNTVQSNTATMYYPDGTLGPSATKTYDGEYKPYTGTISKEGIYDYKKSDGTQAINGETEWRILAHANYELTLKNYSIQDTNFVNAVPGSFKVYTNQYNKIDVPADAYELSGDTLTFNDSMTLNDAYIVFSTKNTDTVNTEAKENRNTAKMIYPGGIEGPSDDHVFSLTESEEDKQNNWYRPFDGSIEVQFDAETQRIKWTFNIQKDYRSNVSNLDGATVTCDLFKEITQSDITVNTINNTFGNTWDNLSYTLDPSSGKLTFNSTGEKLAYQTQISFYTELTPEQLEMLKNDQTVDFKTTAYLNNEEKEFTYDLEITNQNTSYTPTNQLTKTLNTTDKNVIKDLDNLASYELDWTVKLIRDFGFSGDNKVLVDVMSAYDSAAKTDSSEAEHYIANNQRTMIEVYAKTSKDYTGEFVKLTEGTDYTIQFYENKDSTTPDTTGLKSKKFDVTFNQSVDDKNYRTVEVRYKTTADMTNVKDHSQIQFKNEASYNNTSAQSTNSFVVNAYDPDKENIFTKVPVDKNGNVIDTSDSTNPFDINDLEKITLDGTDYYVFNWRINLARPHVMADYIDTFDNGFTLCQDAVHQPKYVRVSTNDTWSETNYQWSHEETFASVSSLTDTQMNKYYYDANTTPNQIRFKNINSEVVIIKYSTKIPVEEFLKKFTSENLETTVKNNVEVYGNVYTHTESASLLVRKTPDAVTYDYVEKAYDGVKNNLVSYTVDINESADDLVLGDSILFNDDFATKSFTPSGGTTVEGNTLADATLYDLKVYEVVNGVERALDMNEYTYRFITDTSYISNFSPTVKEENKGWTYDIGTTGNIYSSDIGELNEGDILTITLNVLSNSVSGTDTSIKIFRSDGVRDTVHSGSITTDDSGKYSFTYVVPKDVHKCRLDLWIPLASEWKSMVDGVEVEVTRSNRDTIAELEMMIPDSKHIRVKYVYEIRQGGLKPPLNSNIIFNNTATVKAAESSTHSLESSADFVYAGATTLTGSYPTIKKYDVGDYALTGLDATFKLAVYDQTAGEWKWCNDDLSYTSDMPVSFTTAGWVNDETQAVGFSTSNGLFMLNGLEDGRIYVLKETAEPKNTPDGFTYEVSDKIKPFYFIYGNAPDTYPTGINNEELGLGNVKSIQIGGIIRVTNNRIVDITVNKEWDEVFAESTSVNVELYWSYTKSVNGFPSDMKLATKQDLNTDNEIDNDVSLTKSYTWSGLPNGKDGKPVYYYVKETAYTIGDKTYTNDGSGAFVCNGEIGKYSPIYIGNATNRSNDNVRIVNSSALRVEKQWLDPHGYELPDHYKTEKVQFKMWGSEIRGGEETPIMNGTSDIFEITPDENGKWIYVFEPSILGANKFFRVEEVGVGTEFTASYYGLYQGSIGKFVITNTLNSDPITSIVVEKTWLDGEGTTRPLPSFTLKSSVDNTTWTNVSGITQTFVEGKDSDKDIWTYTYSNLPYRDYANGGKIFSYKVEEQPMNGYKLTSETNNDGISSGKIELTNTRVIDIDVSKVWFDSYKNEHIDKSVTLKLYRTLNIADVNLETSIEPVEEITVAKSDNWKYHFSELPAYDENNAEYYYWIVEDNVPNYTTNYIYQNSTYDKCILQNDGSIIVQNHYIYEPVMLPATGGSGTLNYYIIGVAIILIGCTLYIVSRKIKNVKR